MSELKTRENSASVAEFLDSIVDDTKRQDAWSIAQMMERITGDTPTMWGNAIVGFGKYHYKYASGREGDWMRIGFSPRKANLTLYLMPGYQFDEMRDLLAKLGPHALGKSCLYIKRLRDIDLMVLEELMRTSLKIMHEKYEV